MSRRLPSTQALACFVAAARYQSYTRAAEALAMTQGAVSRQVASLESQLGVKLFQRTRHGMVLTAAGADFARRARQWLDELERGTLEAQERQTGTTLAVATVPTFATRWLLPRLSLLQQEYPEIELHVETRTRPFIFAETEFDGALFAGTPEQVAKWPGSVATRLLPEVVVPVCSPRMTGYRPGLQPADLRGLPLLQQTTRPLAWREWFEAMGVEAEAGLRGQRFELFSMAAVAASHGLGVALLPSILVTEELARGELVVVSAYPWESERVYYWVTPVGGSGRPVADYFGEWLLAQAQKQQE